MHVISHAILLGEDPPFIDFDVLNPAGHGDQAKRR